MIKTYYALLFALLCAVFSQAQCLVEEFNSGYGNWIHSGTYQNAVSGLSGNGTGFNDYGDEIKTNYALNNPASISLWLARGSNVDSKSLSIQYATDINGPWTTAREIIVSEVITTHREFNINLNLTGAYYIRIVMNQRTNGSYYLDDISITCSTSGSEPEIQLSDISGSNQSCGYTLNYGNVASNGSTFDRSFLIKNIGSVNLNISSFGLNGDFTIVSPTAPISITPNSSQTVVIRFTPSGNGIRSGSLTINNNDSDEFNCRVNLSGVGFTPAPEINVEANSGSFPDIANGDTTPQGTDNTLFAATSIGSSRVKSYRIQNLGTADLSIGTISITGLNPSDFIVDPALVFPITISPSSLITFEVTFAPSVSGQRDATVEIGNNDSDENPYRFAIRGNGNCTASGSTITPSSGPIGTIVTINGNSFGVSTTATINANTVAVNVSSSTQISITIPTGATTGNIVVKNNLGCYSTLAYTVISTKISGCEGALSSIPTDLFISEVTDKGTGSHSYIEIYNGTGSDINMSTGVYQIRIHNNGNSSATATINLSGTILNNSTVLAAIGGADSNSKEGGHTASFFSNTGGINDDDHIRLYKGSSWIDVWGDPSGNTFTVAPKDYTYRRKNTGIIAPSPTWNVSDWESFTPVDYTDIGIFDFSLGAPPSVASQPSFTSSNCMASAILNIGAIEGFIGGKSLNYQWYAAAPGASGWTALVDNVIYNGSNSSQLHIENTAGLNNYQYYARVRENDATCYRASNATVLLTEPTEWNGMTWSKGAPNINRFAIINADYDTSLGGLQTSFSACGLVINAGYELIIANETFIEIQNDITVNGQIIVNPTGAVVQISNGGLINGAVLTDPSKIVVEKETAVINAWYEYTYWSSPVVGASIGNALFQSASNRRFWFNAANYQDSFLETNNNNARVPGQDDIDDDGNDWILAQETDIMQPGIGYAATHSQTAFIGAGNRYKYLFEGAFNNGFIRPTVVRNDVEMNDLNLNFIGNPYPSAIDVDTFFETNLYSNENPTGTLDGIIYLWSQNTAPSSTFNGNQKLNFATSDYAMINGSGEAAGGDGLIPNRYIPSGQGFFVAFSNLYANTSGNVVFNNGMRTRRPAANSQFFRKSTSKNSERQIANKLWINLTSDNGVFSQICLAYVNGASDGPDPLYFDAPRTIPTKTAATLYSRIAGEPSIKLAIQGKHPESLTEAEIIPLGFYSSIDVPTVFSLEIADLKGDFLKDQAIFLRDNEMHTVSNLSDNPYVFTAATGEFNERFELIFNQNTLSNPDFGSKIENLRILELKDGMVQFSIDSPLSLKKIELFDLLGRQIYSFNCSSSSEIFRLESLSQTAYIAKASISNGQVLTKKAVKNY